MALLATALACLAASPGCGGPPVAEEPVTAAAFAISYERTGGLKPMRQKLVIRPGRHAVATASGPNGRLRSVRFRVGRTKIESLRNALARIDFEAIGAAGPNPGTCADCYFYAIRYEGHEVSFDQESVPAELRGIVARLEALIAAHRPFH
jgi:hypothetical protein